MEERISSTVVQDNMRMRSGSGGTARRRGLSVLLASLKLAAVVFLLLTAARPTRVQAFPGFLEGPLTFVDTVARTAIVNGTLMHIPAGIPIVSPTVDLKALAVTQGVDVMTLFGPPLPGRPTGFEGGTCLCATEVDPVTGIVTATNMVLEPAENVLIATVTTHNCLTASCDPDNNPLNELRIGGTLMNPNTDPRLFSDPIVNRGFEVDLLASGNLVGVRAGGEGYFGNDGSIHLYVLELDGGALVNPGVTEVSVLRAQCREREGVGGWTVMGATHNPSNGTVILKRGDTMAVLGTALVITEAADPNFGAYLFGDAVTGTCPDSVIADFGLATVTADVDVRIEDMALPPPGAVVLLTRPIGNLPPVTVDDAIITEVNIESTFGALFLLNNDTDPEGDPLIVFSVTPTSNAGGTIDDNLDGTFTYTPAPGFSGPDTFTYSIADGFIPAIDGNVNVTVNTPIVDNVVVQKALFESGKNEWRVRGTSSIVGPGNNVTVYLGSTVGGTVIGTAAVDVLGDWDFREQNSLILPGLETTVSVVTDAGDILEGFPISFK